MEQSDMKGMWGRYAIFVALSFAIVFLNLYLMSYFSPQGPPKPAERHAVVQGPAARAPNAPASAKPGQGEPAPAGGVSGAKPASGQPQQPAAEPAPPPAVEAGAALAAPAPAETLVTLGSADPKDPYRMLVTLTTRGAAVARIELSNHLYRDIEDRSGYLGHLTKRDASEADGCRVDVVGPGTPAAKAGLLPGDLIVAVNGVKITAKRTLAGILQGTLPDQTVELRISRNGQTLVKKATLTRRPLEVVRPEADDPLSFLLTLSRIATKPDDDHLDLDRLRKRAEEQWKEVAGDNKKAAQALGVGLSLELPGLELRDGNWHLLAAGADPRQPATWGDVAPGDPRAAREVVRFARWLKPWNLAVVKTYRLAKVPAAELSDPTFRAYNLTLEVAVYNLAAEPRWVAYQLDGPTGLPAEGAWYAVKMSNGWSSVGLRDVAVSLDGASPRLVSCTSIAGDDWGVPWKEKQDGEFVTFVGVDAQYFSAIMIPQRKPGDVWFAEARPLRVGAVNPENKRVTDTSCRMTTVLEKLDRDQPLVHAYTVFAGPKRPDLLDRYGLKGLVQYGWFWFVAEPMTWVLHFFHDYVVFNYGLAIFLLTVVVRSCMFPISYKQTLSAQKMQELQPEIKKIQEKYKNMEQRNKATQELFKKHNYNPFGGCLPMFIQLPIFIGLYKALAVDVELRGAPLITESLRWCSNLAAPDMLFNWSAFFPAWFNSGQGMFALGPYFNLLPILTIILFIVQQKMFMPPPADEQAAVQQKTMQFMMIFMGLLFFKVASGLCLYFIASSLWGVAERKLLPKVKKPDAQAAAPAAEQKPSLWAGLLKADGAAAGAGKKRVRKNK